MIPGDGSVGDGDGEGAAGEVTGGCVARDYDGEGAVSDGTVPWNGDGGFTYPDRTVGKPRLKDPGWWW